MSIKGILAASVVVASAAVAGSAQAATGTPYNNYNPVAQSGTFGNNGNLGTSTFTNTFTFVVTKAGTLASDFSNSSAVNNSGTDIDFTSGALTGGTLTSAVNFTKLLGDSSLASIEVWAAPKAFLGAGTYTLTLIGQPYGNAGTYSGNFSVTAVPELATWAMMILGIGAIGAVQRRRVASTKVRFA